MFKKKKRSVFEVKETDKKNNKGTIHLVLFTIVFTSIVVVVNWFIA